MKARYFDKKELTPEDRGLVTEVLCTCFDDISVIQKVALETLGDDIHDNINWNEDKKWVYRNLVIECDRKGAIGILLEQVKNLLPDNWLLERLINRLLRTGYIGERMPEAPTSSEA